MQSILVHPDNRSVIRYLCRTSKDTVLTSAGDHADPYWRAGAHPEIVERVWDQLGAALPPESRQLICGTPVLAHPNTGRVVAICMGTSYCVLVPSDNYQVALAWGFRSTNEWSDGSVTNLAIEFGTGWVFGAFDEREQDWIQALMQS